MAFEHGVGLGHPQTRRGIDVDSPEDGPEDGGGHASVGLSEDVGAVDPARPRGTGRSARSAGQADTGSTASRTGAGRRTAVADRRMRSQSRRAVASVAATATRPFAVCEVAGIQPASTRERGEGGNAGGDLAAAWSSCVGYLRPRITAVAADGREGRPRGRLRLPETGENQKQIDPERRCCASPRPLGRTWSC